MKKFKEDYALTQDLMDAIATYMHDDIREELHNTLAPCEPEIFLKEYVKRDSDFADLLKSEFSIEIESEV